MEEIEVSEKEAIVGLTLLDLVFLSNCVNETFRSVEDWELQTLTAASPAELKTLWAELQQILRKVKDLGTAAEREANR
jgi:hypothetical protein